MKSETIIGALIAATILFLSNIVTLFTENTELVLGDLKQATWISIGGGALIAFFKDYQALSTRRAIASATGSKNVHSLAPWLLAPLLGLMLAVSGCGVQAPKVDSLSDAIAVAAANIETAAQTTLEQCGNTTPGGPCRAGATITTSQKETVRERLQEAQDLLVNANIARLANNSVAAENRLGRAEAILRVIQGILEERIQ